jgi:hypothetical protein
MRRRYRFIDGQCVEVSGEEQPQAKGQIINSEMPPTKHPITGEYYTSKTKFRAVTKAHGCEEVGTAYDNGWTPPKDDAPKRLRDQRIDILREALG